MYEITADRMVTLAQQQPGFLGVESVRGDDGIGITVSYWTDRDAITEWRGQAEHMVAQAWAGRNFMIGTGYAPLRLCRNAPSCRIISLKATPPTRASPTNASGMVSVISPT
jgi:hypothetical protein